MNIMTEIMGNWRKFLLGGDTTAAKLGGHPITLKVLRSPGDQREGFMNKPEPDDSFGLLFLYSEPRILGFWMKNVPFDLDLIGLNDGMQVTEIIRLRANDESTKVLSSPCTQVLELKAGWCDRHGVDPGDILELPSTF